MSPATIRAAVGSPDGLAQEFDAATRELESLEAELDRVRARRRAAVLGLKRHGLSYTQIGVWFGLSRQRMQQIGTWAPHRRVTARKAVAA